MSTIKVMTARGATARARKDALAQAMYADYQGGLTLAEVGAKHGGLSMSAVFSIFKRRGLERRKRMNPGVYQKVAATRRTHLDALVAEMHADYMRPMSLSAVGRKYKRTRESVRELFATRGLTIRQVMIPPLKLANGQIAPYVPLTAAEIDALIARATRVIVPDALKFEWRKWSMECRRDFVQRLRARLALPGGMPTTPCSAGIEPFAYGHPRAHAIVAKANVGCGSHPKMSIKTTSQGVIWQDTLWFWSPKTGYERGPWTKEAGRPLLHHIIYEAAHGKIPPKSVVRFADGNWNNLDPANLVLASRNDLARENQAKAFTRISRARVAHLLNRHQQPASNHDLAHRLLTASR
jgi:hypothetical protein